MISGLFSYFPGSAAGKKLWKRTACTAAWIFICFSVLASDPPTANWERCWTDRFEQLAPPVISGEDQARLRKRNVDTDAVMRMRFPVSWKTNRHNFPQKFTIRPFSPAGGIVVDTQEILEFSRETVNTIDNCRYRFLCKAAGNGNITLGVGYGKAEQTTLKINSQTPVTLDPIFEKGLEEQHGKLTPILKIKGSVSVLEVELQRQVEPEVSVVEGTIPAISAIPDPAKSDYPDCYYTASFSTVQIVAGKPVPRNIQLVIPAFIEKKKTGFCNMLKQDTNLKLRIVPFEKLPEKLKSIQQADNLGEYDKAVYLVQAGDRRYEFDRVDYGIPFLETEGAYTSVYESNLNPPVSAAARQDQITCIQRELERVKSFIQFFAGKEQKLNEKFQPAWKNEQSKTGKHQNLIANRIVWVNLDGTFWALPKNHRLIPENLEQKPVSDNNIAALRAFRDMLEANGIQLIIQLIPDLYDVAARKLNPEFSDVPDLRQALLARQLLEAGIETLCTTDYLLKNRITHPLMFFYPDNGHPHSGCQDLLTTQMAERLKKRFPGEWNDDTRSDGFSLGTEESGYSWPVNCDTGKFVPGSKMIVESIRYNGGNVPFRSGSKILVIGNSYSKTPMSNGAYPAYLSWKLQYITDYFLASGDGPFTTVFLSCFNSGKRYLNQKKVVILPIGYHISAKIPFVNIRDLDNEKKILSGKHPVGTVELGEKRDKFAPSDCPEYSGERQIRWEEHCRHIQGLFVVQSRGVMLGSFPLPVKADAAKETLVQVQVSSFWGHHAILEVNGTKQEIPITLSKIPRWNNLIFRLQPGDRRLSLQLHTSDKMALVAIRAISFYQ